MLSEIREDGWDEFIHRHNRKPNLKSAFMWLLDELFWRIKYLIGDPHYGSVEGLSYWEDDLISCWKRSYSRE